MVAVAFNLASLSGWGYLILSLIYLGSKVILISRGAKKWSTFTLIGEMVIGALLTTTLLIGGVILILYGWRLDPIMQFGQVWETAIVILISIKDIFNTIERSR